MQVGDILIAKDPCAMDYDEIDALIVGKEYKVEDISSIHFNPEIKIKSEIDDNHFFSLNKNDESYYGLFFVLKTTAL